MRFRDRRKRASYYCAGPKTSTWSFDSVKIAALAVGLQGKHGGVTDIAREYSVSRPTVYDRAERAREALTRMALAGPSTLRIPSGQALLPSTRLRSLKDRRDRRAGLWVETAVGAVKTTARVVRSYRGPSTPHSTPLRFAQGRSGPVSRSGPSKKGQPFRVGLLVESGRRDLNSRRQPWQGCTLPLSYSRELSTGEFLDRMRGVVKGIFRLG